MFSLVIGASMIGSYTERFSPGRVVAGGARVSGFR
ncbi:hypothetical protein SBRY_10974 [Actinacidiphila bryophytorum]|uniref:Uncharacterized protein n=1 Tax=Actinacidiphila bryophytorum TaxID=1436133 RepID=A0A9W4E767_9ACTN|nr:hypothetical protein SBRY_10974 [Actinacidiphila bryophytorum]